MKCPRIIQGGMGAGVSHWQLARAVSRTGQLGVVSGTALDVILVRRLQDGDPSGDIRRALAAFPCPAIARRIVDEYFVEGGRPEGTAYRNVARLCANPGKRHQELVVVANFVEVYLAREGHEGLVGINFLGKIQMATLASLYGAMLAGVDFVLVGAGIPTQIPGVLDRLVRHEPVVLRLAVHDALPEDDFRMELNPGEIVPVELPELKRPAFLGIVSSVAAATALLRRASGSVEGFIVEGPTAGGHNAPPRDGTRQTERGEPLYGAKDQVDLARIKQLGKPFWPAGGYCFPDRVQQAFDAGAAGVQVGSLFALSADSGLEPSIRSRILADVAAGNWDVFTDPHASPTGFPFKVLSVAETHSEREVAESRRRLCDLGYLTTPYRRDDGSLGYRCAAEPVDAYVAKGGNPEDTRGRKCLCNALLANIGLGQVQKDGLVELPLVTAGDDLTAVKLLLDRYGPDYSAAQAVEFLLGEAGL